jgi:hypothetical protein
MQEEFTQSVSYHRNSAWRWLWRTMMCVAIVAIYCIVFVGIWGSFFVSRPSYNSYGAYSLASAGGFTVTGAAALRALKFNTILIIFLTLFIIPATFIVGVVGALHVNGGFP